MARVRGLVISMVAVLGLGACGGGSGGPPAQAPVRGGTMTVAIWQEPSTLYPYYTTQTMANVVYEIALEPLVGVLPNGTYQAVLATEIPTSGNGGVKLVGDGRRMDVTYHLRPGVWADGEALTSDDVRFTWQAIVKDPKVTSRSAYDQIESVDSPDRLTAVVHYRTIYSAYARLFPAVLPKHALEKEPDISKSDFVRLPFGTGPFKIAEFSSGDHITAVRNSHYRASTLQSGR